MLEWRMFWARGARRKNVDKEKKKEENESFCQSSEKNIIVE